MKHGSEYLLQITPMHLRLPIQQVQEENVAEAPDMHFSSRVLLELSQQPQQRGATIVHTGQMRKQAAKGPKTCLKSRK